MSNLNWTDFGAAERDAFQGCESDAPRIAEVWLAEDMERDPLQSSVVIDDGGVFHLVDADAAHEWRAEGDGVRERIESTPQPWHLARRQAIGFRLLIGDEAGVS